MRAAVRLGMAAVVIATVSGLRAGLLAQGEAGARPRVFSGIEVRTVSFDSGLGTKSVSEVVVPIGVIWPITRRITIDLGSRYARATRTDEADSSTSISGLTDTQARAVLELVPDVLVLTVAANLPTGKTELTADELPVAGTVASDLIPFPVSNFGSGFNATTGLALAVPVGAWALGVAGSYRLSSEFTPLAAGVADSGTSFKAGSEMRFRVGLERLVGQSRVSLGFTYSSFARDEFAGSEIFAPGNRYISQVSWSFPLGNIGVSLYAWDLYRAAGIVARAGAATEKQNLLAAGAAATVQVGRNSLRPTIEYRRQTEGVSTLAQAGSLLSVGARFQWALGGRFSLVPSARFDTGDIGSGGPSDVGFRGFSFGASLRASL